MRLSAVAVLMILTTVFLSACSQQQMASIDDHQGQYYGRMGNSSNQTVMAASTMAVTSAPIGNSTSYGNASFSNAPFGHASAPYRAPVAQVTPNQPVAMNTAPVVQDIQPLYHASAVHTAAALPTPAAASNTGYQWPVEGKIIEGFGKQANGIANEGISIAAADGTPIKAAAGGEVAYVGTNVRDYGNMVILRHDDGALTSYAHAREILVSKGDRVLPGDVLGYVGHSGSVTTPQLHFAMRQGDHVVDPVSKLPQQVASR